MTKLILFLVLSVGPVALSWRFLRLSRSHGFYRFFALECILALILLNADRWFTNPFSLPQLISWLLLLGSTVLVLWGVHLLVGVGRPAPSARREEELGIEATTALITVGIYRYIRHPLYASLLFLGWGAFFKHVTFSRLLLAVAMSAFLTATAKVEEVENLRKFGDAYAAYRKSTKMFVPFVV
jgi:protein-S-isoprenylcysteine O-methyltransferase Ste14